MEEDPTAEELRTDLTTVFLGRVLTTNATSRMRARGELVGVTVRHE